MTASTATPDEPSRRWKLSNLKNKLLWMILAACFALLTSKAHTTVQERRRRLTVEEPKQERILYIVTTLNEYNSGTRNTEKGSDRLQETLIPVVSQGIATMVQAGYRVDLFLVCHFTMRPERLQLVQHALPKGVKVDVWSDATPLGYDTSKKGFTTLENRTLHLARQHRFVIKERLMDYDIFVNFEDDMYITARHVQYFVNVTTELERLAAHAPSETLLTKDQAVQSYHGSMTKEQLLRMMPGFIRVEALLDEDTYPAQSNTGPVPLVESRVDPSVCCHPPSRKNIPDKPPSHKLMLWETNIKALGIRQLPADSFLDWAVLLRGPSQTKLNATSTIGDYWSNRNNDYYPNERRPIPMEFKYINNQGGWMATRNQLWRWHTRQCPGGFLPPYEAPHYRFDGLDMRNVEWYSGGMQLCTVRHACNLQRIIPIAQLSSALLYHTANNKQRQLAGKRESTFTKADTLLGQLLTIQARAEQDMKEGK